MKGTLQVTGARRRERAGRGAARVVDDDVEPPEVGDGAVGEPGEQLFVVDVGGHHERPPPVCAHLLGDGLELRFRAGREQHVGPGLGERDGCRRTDPAACAGDDRDLPVDPKPFEHHFASPLGRMRPLPVT